MKLSIETLDAKMFPLLLELKDLYHRILRERAKGIVVEEQLEALAQTVSFRRHSKRNVVYAFVTRIER